MGKALNKHRMMENCETGPNGLVHFLLSKDKTVLSVTAGTLCRLRRKAK